MAAVGSNIKTEDAVAASTSTDDSVIYRVVFNDGNPDHLQALVAAKNVFANQLPKMPKEYIARLVVDRNHRTMVIQQGQRVIAGICYRPFFTQRFAEIVFCAVQSVEQGKGYGRYIMAHLKEHVKSEGIDHFLTYADNNAIKYFAKQGFTKVLAMCPDRWKGWIKDYDGATLMECAISREVNYLELPALIAAQRHAVFERIMQISNTHRVYPGLESLPAAPASIPGLAEAGWQPNAYPKPRLTSREAVLLVARLGAMLKVLYSLKEAWAFRKPVDGAVVLDYYSVIKEPMDLQTMRQKLNAGAYSTLKQFTKDVALVVGNCKRYNGAQTTYYRHAEDTWTAYVKLVQQHFPDEKPPVLE
jgi:histone acetyltransferase